MCINSPRPFWFLTSHFENTVLNWRESLNPNSTFICVRMFCEVRGEESESYRLTLCCQSCFLSWPPETLQKSKKGWEVMERVGDVWQACVCACVYLRVHASECVHHPEEDHPVPDRERCVLLQCVKASLFHGLCGVNNDWVERLTDLLTDCIRVWCYWL